MPEQRQQDLDRMRRHGAFDVVVLGGGINGIGVYRELALQGLRVLLVERNDFCSGCSAAPSRMIHGGLRYLENGEFGLVWESLRERDALLANAPHMVRPLPTTIPIESLFSGMMNGAVGFFGLSGRPASRGALPIKIGLMLYDWITRHRRRLPRHQFRGARSTLAIWPALSPDLRFSATYHDAWISHPERMGIELILDTQRLSPGSIALNHAELRPQAGGFTVAERTTGELLPVSARAMVNATGAWLDESLALLADGSPAGEPFVSGTKGSHLILDHPALHDALGGHMIFFEHADGRVCIVFPYLGRVLAGSTDIRVDGAGRVRCEPEERDYILNALHCVFPGIAVGPEHVIFSYSGIRPLPRSDHEFTGRISRSHSVHRLDGAVPQFCMVGGKWTTFRAFAEQTADAVLAELGHARVANTLALPIGGGTGFPAAPGGLATELVRHYGIAPLRAAHLADLYGTRAEEVLAFCSGRADDRPLAADCRVTTGEIAFLARHEFALGLGDVLLRRTSLSIRGSVSTGLIRRVAAILADELGWDEKKKTSEVEAFTADLADYHGVSREMLDRRDKGRS
jgi:glycerol-3-phosphate dehydrogenase